MHYKKIEQLQSLKITMVNIDLTGIIQTNNLIFFFFALNCSKLWWINYLVFLALSEVLK